MGVRHYYLPVTESENGVTVPCVRLIPEKTGLVEKVENCVMCPQFLEAYKGQDNQVRVTCTWPRIARGKKRGRTGNSPSPDLLRGEAASNG